MAIKALKQNVSICEIQKMIHQWKNRGINDPTVTKLLDLHLGMPAYMNESGIYPLCNFYYIRIALKFSYTTALITAVTDCHTFGLIWDEGHTKIIAFYSPLWYHKSDKETKNVQQDSAQKTPQDSAQDSAFFNSNILYNINNIYSPKDSHKGLSCEDIVQKQPNIPSENPTGTPHGDEAPKASSSAKEFFHKLNATPEEKQAVLVPIIDRIVAGYRYTRPRALDALVVLVNEFLIPHFDAQSNFAKTPHNGRIIWLQNLIKTRHGENLIQQATQKLGETLLKELEEQRKKLREFRPVSPFEWKDADKDIRYYDDPIDGKVEIPADAPPRPSDEAIWNVLSQKWVDTDGQHSGF